MPVAESETETSWTPERIRDLRERRNWSLLEAATRVGVKPRTWLSWELPSQERKPSPSHEILLDLLNANKL